MNRAIRQGKSRSARGAWLAATAEAKLKEAMKIDSKSHGFSRDVAKRTKRARRAYVMCSAKNGNVEIRLESRLEQSVAQALELDPRVREYALTVHSRSRLISLPVMYSSQSTRSSRKVLCTTPRIFPWS